MTTTEGTQVALNYTLQYCNPKELKIAVCYAQWNKEITHKLRDGATSTLEKCGIPRNNIYELSVPGAFELNYAAAACLKSKSFDAIIILGCVIRGETTHYDCICNGVTQGITELNLRADKPIAFGLITTENMEQAEDRCGGKLGNKGSEAAICVLQMIDFSCILEKE